MRQFPRISFERRSQFPSVKLSIMADQSSSDDGLGSALPRGSSRASIESIPSEIFAQFAAPKPKALPSQLHGMGEDMFRNAAYRIATGRHSQRLPWERGYAAAVLGIQAKPLWPFVDPPLGAAVRADQLARASSSSTTVVPLPQNISRTAARRVKFLPQTMCPDALRQRALLKWRMIIESDLEATMVGQQLLAMIENLEPENDILEMLTNVFSVKKTGTLVKRVGAMMTFLVWSRGKAIYRPLLCEETVIYAYVSNMLKTGCAPTRAAHFKQALAFYRHLLGCPSADAALASTRIKGCCSRQFKRKRKTKKAPALKVDHLRILEHLTMNASLDADRCAAGFFSFCSLSSSRGHDAMNAEVCTVETDTDGSMCIELGTSDHKTATTAQLQTQLLPLIAFSPGLIRGGSGWGAAWMEARARCGLTFGTNRPVLPALGSDGKFLSRACSNGELIAWLRELIVLGGGVINAETMHSCKATILEWTAKWGLDPEERRLLGHHSHPHLKSILSYSRDALAKPLSHVWEMLSQIIAGTFDPEAPRIRRIRGDLTLPPVRGLLEVHTIVIDNEVEAPAIAPTTTEAPVQGSPVFASGTLPETLLSHVAPEQTSSDSSESSSDSSDLSISDMPDVRHDDQFIEAAGLSNEPPQVHLTGFRTFQHRTSGTIHYRADSDPSFLLCKRVVSASYTVVTGSLIYDWPKCQVCNGRAVD